MAFIIKDRVKETTTTTGTGPVALSDALATFDTFSSYMSDGDTAYYAIVHTFSGVDEWEVGLGTWNTGNTITRTTILSGSNGTSAQNFSAGTKDVFMTYPASKAMFLDANGDVAIPSDLDIAGSLDVGESLEVETHIDLKTTVGNKPSHAEGRIFYDAAFGALAVYNDEADITLQVGQEEYIRIKNNTGATVTNGTPVYLTGEEASTPTIGVARADGNYNQSQAVGIATHDIETNSVGYITVRGLIADVDTSHLTVGEKVHVGIGASGGTQTASPTYPNYPTEVGVCLITSASGGCIYVYTQTEALESLRVTGNSHFDANVTIDGDLTVLGNQTIASTSNVAIANAFNYFNSGDTIGALNTAFTGTGLDDASLTGHFTGTTTTNYYIRIDSVGGGTGGVDTFEWSVDNFATFVAQDVDITGSDQLIHSTDNIAIKFNATTGHTLGDVWTGTGSPINVDTGFTSNRNTGTSGIGYTHLGIFYDVSTNKWTVFDEYSPEPEGTIDVGHSSFSYGTLKAGTFEGNLDGDVSGDLVGNSAGQHNGSVVGNVTGNVTGNLTGSVTGNADTASTLATARTVQLTGDVIGSAAFDGSANISITASVQDDSHAHVISNVDGLQTALDGKTPDSRTITAGNGLTGGGDLTSNRTLTVGSGTGITVNANDIAIDSSYTGFDVRYYTETEADSRFVNVTGDTMTGNLSVDKLVVGSNTVGTESDIALTANVAINAENSLSFGMTNASTGYYRWMFGNTSNTGGTAGGVEKMRLSPSGNLTLSGTVDGVDIAARNGVLTSTTTTANAALPKAGGTMTGDATFASGANIHRSTHSSGSLVGSYNNVGANALKTNPIYTIGTSYFPTDSSLENMYGIGFTKGSSHPGAGVAAMLGTGWGLYVAADGDARIGLDSSNGIIRSTGVAYVNTNQRVFADNYHPNADKLTTAKNINGVAFDGTANITVADSTKLPKAGGTMTGDLTINEDGDSLHLRNATNGGSVGVSFSSDVPADQIGHLRFAHSDSVSYGSGAVFVLGSTESTTTILADGKLMFDEGIYSKPATGTGAGTRKDSNWDTAYTTANAALPKAGGTLTGGLTGTSGTFSGTVDVNQLQLRDMGDYITFYGNGATEHSISSRNNVGGAADDLRFNSYGAVYINLDSNNNNTSGANFQIGKHGGAAGTITNLFTVSGENGDLTIPGKIIHSGDTDTYFEFHGADTARMVLAGAEVQEWGANYTLFGDNDTVRLGAGSDFRMYFNGADTFFRNYAHANGDVYFQGEGSDGVNENAMKLDFSGTSSYVILYQNSGERLRTLSGGVGVTGLTVGDADASPHNAGGLQISNSNNEKIVLSGSTDPFIRFQEGTTDKAYIQWNDSGYLDFRNMESGEFKFQSTVDGQASELILIRNDTTTATGNDLGSINFGHTDGAPDWPSQWVTQLPARIVAEATETTGGSDDGARLRFFTKANNVEKAVDSIESMRLEHNGDAVFYHELSVPNTIFHSGDTNTYMQFSAADTWRVVTGGTPRLTVGNDTMTVAATLSMSGHTLNMNNNDITGVDQIFHHGDTNTYIQFHAADQFRVVTGGVERLEVNNSRTQIDTLLVTGTTTLSGTVVGAGNTITGTVGTYAWLGSPTARTLLGGVNYSGSGLKYAGTTSTGTYSDNTAARILGAVPSGTWRAMGTADVPSRYGATLFLRIS